MLSSVPIRGAIGAAAPGGAQPGHSRPTQISRGAKPALSLQSRSLGNTYGLGFPRLAKYAARAAAATRMAFEIRTWGSSPRSHSRYATARQTPSCVATSLIESSGSTGSSSRGAFSVATPGRQILLRKSSHDVD